MEKYSLLGNIRDQPIFLYKFKLVIKILDQPEDKILELEVARDSMVNDLFKILKNEFGVELTQYHIFFFKNLILDNTKLLSYYFKDGLLEKYEIYIKKKIIRLLSLDGGGIRGIMATRVLEEIEKNTKLKIHELFDVIVGTSTGGIITILSSIPKRDGTIFTAEEIKQFYIERGKDIFIKNYGYIGILGEKYKTTGLESIIDQYFSEDIGIKDAVLPVGVVATDMDKMKSILINSMRAKFHLDDYRNNLSVYNSIRCTSAAPVYFKYVELYSSTSIEKIYSPEPHTEILVPPYYKRDKIYVEDGGTTCNNPAMMCINYAASCLNLYDPKVGNKSRSSKVSLADMVQFKDYFKKMKTLLSPPVNNDIKNIKNIKNNNDDSDGDINNKSEKRKTISPRSSSSKITKRAIEKQAKKRIEKYDFMAMDSPISKRKDYQKTTDHDYDIFLVSIGTGTLDGEQNDPHLHVPQNNSLRGLAYRFSQDPFNILKNVHNIHEQVKREYTKGKEGSESNYYRVQFKCTQKQLNEMDNVSKSNIANLLKSAEGYIYTDKEKNIYSNHFNNLLAHFINNRQYIRPIHLKSSTDNDTKNLISIKRTFFVLTKKYFNYTKFGNGSTTLINDIHKLISNYLQFNENIHTFKTSTIKNIIEYIQTNIQNVIKNSIKKIMIITTLKYIANDSTTIAEGLRTENESEKIKIINDLIAGFNLSKKNAQYGKSMSFFEECLTSEILKGTPKENRHRYFDNQKTLANINENYEDIDYVDGDICYGNIKNKIDMGIFSHRSIFWTTGHLTNELSLVLSETISRSNYAKQLFTNSFEIFSNLIEMKRECFIQD